MCVITLSPDVCSIKADHLFIFLISIYCYNMYFCSLIRSSFPCNIRCIQSVDAFWIASMFLYPLFPACWLIHLLTIWLFHHAGSFPSVWLFQALLPPSCPPILTLWQTLSIPLICLFSMYLQTLPPHHVILLILISSSYLVIQSSLPSPLPYRYYSHVSRFSTRPDPPPTLPLFPCFQWLYYSWTSLPYGYSFHASMLSTMAGPLPCFRVFPPKPFNAAIPYGYCSHASGHSTIAAPPQTFHMFIVPMFPSILSPALLYCYCSYASGYSTMASPSQPFHVAIVPMLPWIPNAASYSTMAGPPQPFHMAIVPMLLGIPLWLTLPKPSIWLLLPCFQGFPIQLGIPL